MKKILLLLLFINTASFSQQTLYSLLNKWNKNNVPYISVDSLASINTPITMLDAREYKEYNISHLKNAICVGFNSFNIDKTIQQLPKNKQTLIVVYCSLGIRSEIIAHQLIQKGYFNTFNLYGGIFEWKNHNFKIVDTLGESTEKIHAFNKDWSKWLKKGEKIY